jgi:hypothetical protein
MVLSENWLHESYAAMINTGRFNLEELSRNYRFDPGQDTGIARVIAPGISRSFTYSAIHPSGTRAWSFEGSSLTMQLRSSTTLAVQFQADGGSMRTLLFVSLPKELDSLIREETIQREMMSNTIFTQGPVYTSNNYGSITFMQNGSFVWEGFDLLVPQFIPENAAGSGTVAMDLFLAPGLENRYTGAFTMRFSGTNTRLRCMYALDSQGFRIEIIPESNIDNGTVMQRAASPMVLFFFKGEEQ